MRVDHTGQDPTESGILKKVPMLIPMPCMQVFKDKWFCKDLPASVESYNDQYAKDTAVNPALLSLLSEAQKALPGYEDELDEEEGSGMMLYDEDIDDMAELDPII